MINFIQTNFIQPEITHDQNFQRKLKRQKITRPREQQFRKNKSDESTYPPPRKKNYN